MATQTQNKTYYALNRERIIIQKRKYQKEHRDEINAQARRSRRRNKAFNHRCFICGGAVVNDPGTGVWQCLNPECEAEFVEVE